MTTEPPPAPDAPVAPYAPSYTTAPTGNGLALASLVLGIIGFVLMAIPLFIGLIIGGIPDLIAVVLGIVGLTNEAARAGRGRVLAIVGIVLGGVSLLSVFVGGGWLW